MAYTDQQRGEALTAYLDYGAAEASRQIGIPARTIRRWANDAELTAARSQKLEEAHAALAIRHAEMREELRVRLLEKALDALDRMDETHVDYRGKDARRIEWPVAPSGAFKDYATGAAILIDKYRLEMGEHTARAEVTNESAIDAEVRRLVDELGRQRQSEAASPPVE